MKRWIALLLGLALALQLTGCIAAEHAQENDDDTLLFYYCTRDFDPASGETVEDDYGTETGALAAEPRKLPAKDRHVEEVLEAYLAGPERPTLYSPVPARTEEFHWKLEEKILSLWFGSETRRMTGIQKTLAAACLTNTLTQLPGVSSIYAPELSGSMLKATDFLLMDDTAFSNEMILRLYFADETGRYLRPEMTSHLFQENESMSSFAIRALLAEPREEEDRMALPHGTRLFWSRVEDGVCTVNLSEEFLNNAPTTHVEARTAVFSVVNTLTELPEIESVHFICAGMKIEDYVGLDLSEPLYREESAILTPREEQWSCDATLYVACDQEERLAPVPVMVANPEPNRLPWNLLQALVEFKPINSYENPIPDGTVITNLVTDDGLCTVTFNSAFAQCDSDAETAGQAVHAVVSTLCQLDGVERVLIQVEEEVLSHVDLSQALYPNDQWVMP